MEVLLTKLIYIAGRFLRISMFIVSCMLIGLSIQSCSKTESIPPIESEDDSLIFESFHFEQKNNPQFAKDVVFDIQANSLNGQLKHYNYTAIPSFTTNAKSVKINGIDQVSGSSSVDYRKTIVYTLTSDRGTSKTYQIKIAWDNALAHIEFTTEGNVDVTSKTEYVATDIRIDGQTKFSDFEGQAQIRGRGNSTWSLPKKPYKFKLNDDAELLGLAAEKDWILLANFLDGTHMMNAVGMKIAQLLEMPFTNHIIPVEVSLNGRYLGAFMLTEQVEVKTNRVDIGKDGVLLNVDRNYDEPWQFRSSAFDLPVTVKYPKEIDAEVLTEIKTEFQAFEDLVERDDFATTDYLDYLDASSFVNYLIVYMLIGNEEINHPKSTYMYKTEEGKYTMGPVWDFDWAFAFEGSLVHFSRYDRPLFWSPPSKGTQFFSKILTDPAIKTLLKDTWFDFKASHLPELLTYIDDYAFIVQGARARDYNLWSQGNANYDTDVSNLKNWLANRANWMDKSIGAL